MICPYNCTCFYITSHRTGLHHPLRLFLHTAYDLCKERLWCVKSGTLSPKSNMTTMSTMSTGNFLWVDMAAVDPSMEQKAALESKIVGLKVPYTFAPLTGCSVQMTGTTLLQWQPRTATNSRWIPAMEIELIVAVVDCANAFIGCYLHWMHEFIQHTGARQIPKTAG